MIAIEEMDFLKLYFAIWNKMDTNISNFWNLEVVLIFIFISMSPKI